MNARRVGPALRTILLSLTLSACAATGANQKKGAQREDETDAEDLEQAWRARFQPTGGRSWPTPECHAAGQNRAGSFVFAGLRYPSAMQPSLEIAALKDDASIALRLYRTSQRRWRHRYRHCAYLTCDLEELRACVLRNVSPNDRYVVNNAISEFDAQFQHQWPQARSEMDSMRSYLMRTASSKASLSLMAQLIRISAVTSAELEVLMGVRDRPGRLGYAAHDGRRVTIEIGADVPRERLLGTLYHELAHAHLNRSPARNAMRQALVAAGETGWIAHHHYDEAVASAFAKMAVTTFASEQTARTHHYADPTVDALSFALFDEWKQGRVEPLGPGMAQQMIQLVNNVWPKPRRRLQDLIASCDIFSNDADSRALILRTSKLLTPRISFSGMPRNLSTRRGRTPAGSTVVLAQPKELKRRSVRKTLGMTSPPPAEVSSRPMLYRGRDSEGLPLFVFTAPTVERLRRVATYVANRSQHMRIPSPGWHRLTLTE